MKEIFITLLISLGGNPLPSINDGWVSGYEHCSYIMSKEAFAHSKCLSKLEPDTTFHIYNSNHCLLTRAGLLCEYKEHVNLFVKNGIVFEIPLEELFNFYQLK